LVLVAILVFLVAGCGRGDRPELAPVEGAITLDGDPLAGATVVFTPVQGKKSRAITDEKGHYELIYLRDIKGAIPGEHTVTINTATEHQPEELLPARYNRQTELRAEVEAGEKNVIAFQLESRQP
jgi:hypothetical protein